MTEALKACEGNRRIPIRLIICVDGTWTGPDGTYPAKNGNISNIFRIWCCAKEDQVIGADGREWRQQRVYVRGIDDTGSWLGKVVTGVFATGVEQQIKSVYQMCCERACHPEDEVFLFGYSRGAFVVRAVANLLAYMRIPGHTSDQKEFDQAYDRILEVYQAVRIGGKQQAGSIYEYMSSSRPPPKIQFLGVIDSVKAYDDGGLYEIGLHPALRHCRHAVAINETDPAYAPQLWMLRPRTAEYELRKASKLHSVLEGWFLGTHGSLGGAKSEDGAALYAAQWLLSEAKDAGLVLGFATVCDSSLVPAGLKMDNPLEVIFPAPLVDIPNAVRASDLVMKNGVEVNLWDMSEIHRRPGLALSMPDSLSRWTIIRRDRQIFSSEDLIGHLHDTPLGTFVHPSVYIIPGSNLSASPINLGQGLEEALDRYRQDELADTLLASKSNDQITMPVVSKFRLLVCGSAGVGKSTLVNLLLGVPEMTQESHGAHGVHDVETGFSPDDAPYIVHDSCGFQAGQDDELDRVRSLLRTRSKSANIDERVHLLLYCVSSTRLRTTESADAEVLRLVAESDSRISVVVVSTRFDEVEALCTDEVERSVLSESGKRSRRQLAPEEWDVIESRVQEAMDQKKEHITAGLQAAGTGFVGPVFTSKDDGESVAALTEIITASMTDVRIQEMFIAAQICSVQPKIDFAIDHSIRLYGHAIRTSALPIAFSGLIASTTITAMIVRDVLKAFHFTGYSTDLAVSTISTMLVGNYESNGVYVAANLLSVATAGSMATVVASPLGLALGAGSYMLKLSAVPQFGRMLLMCTIDTVLIMERVFWRSTSRASTLSDLRKACAAYKQKMDAVHAAVKNMLPLWSVWDAFQFKKLRTELGRIVDDHRLRKDR
ncbi:hypothetical protein LTR78_008249 [Recurvomyces mirabilis]|uniref:T6SS Phospholipase effector Tle1-like catalytic domain-containing protein n=1 Tax=Recurvomyces mirabilis TaxID=574656 RepID=A0AAE0TTF9_9PEZI|nr:hypothetical protein LTR78_008249 [Recurvomyces mirabilis]KAK5156534.1 hypothetical protein LTS14_004746 [Recurvomyces mirabilis]